MTKHDRAKLLKRLDGYMFPRDRFNLLHIVAREVDRAVKAERKKWQDDEDQRIESLRKIDADLIDGLKRIGAPKL